MEESDSGPGKREAAMPPEYEPIGLHTVRPYLIVGDADRAMSFYRDALDAEVLERIEKPAGGVAHAKVGIGEAIIELGEHPHAKGRKAEELPRVGLRLYVKDVDETYERAIQLGSTGDPPSNRLQGSRAATVYDPYGLTWWLVTTLEEA
jgi:PhnB protein